MKELKKRRSIEQATLFKVEYVCYLNDDMQVASRKFNNVKSLNQWSDRNDNENTFGIMIIKKMALIDDTWEPFTTIGKKTVTLSDLNAIVHDLEGEFIIPRISKNEGLKSSKK